MILGTKSKGLNLTGMNPITKICSKCGEEKELSEFYPRKGGKFGVRADCKECVIKRSVKWGKEHPTEKNAQNKRWRDAHPDEFRAFVYAWNAAHPEQAAANRAAWADENPDKIRRAVDKWQALNPARVKGFHDRRHKREIQATPAWANEFFIDEIYALAKMRTELTGIEWHVDHIVPLQSKRVCGLHWEGNLQVIPAKVNMQKGNRYWPDMPEHPSQSVGQ